jgi:hypothetical protein
MLYLGIDQHARQITISLRDDQGDVVQARQVSTEPKKINAFFQQLTRERLRSDESFVAVLEVCGFNDWLIRMPRDYRSATPRQISPEGYCGRSAAGRPRKYICRPPVMVPPRGTPGYLLFLLPHQLGHIGEGFSGTSTHLVRPHSRRTKRKSAWSESSCTLARNAMRTKGREAPGSCMIAKAQAKRSLQPCSGIRFAPQT